MSSSPRKKSIFVNKHQDGNNVSTTTRIIWGKKETYKNFLKRRKQDGRSNLRKTHRQKMVEEVSILLQQSFVVKKSTTIFSNALLEGGKTILRVYEESYTLYIKKQRVYTTIERKGGFLGGNIETKFKVLSVFYFILLHVLYV